jgi:hypothetical protein
VIRTHYGKVRLLDDAFTKTCLCITDIYTSVRSMAAGFLGNFQDVGGSFILQTLGKEVLAGASKGSITLARGRQTLDYNSKRKPLGLLSHGHSF